MHIGIAALSVGMMPAPPIAPFRSIPLGRRKDCPVASRRRLEAGGRTRLRGGFRGLCCDDAGIPMTAAGAVTASAARAAALPCRPVGGGEG